MQRCRIQQQHFCWLQVDPKGLPCIVPEKIRNTSNNPKNRMFLRKVGFLKLRNVIERIGFMKKEGECTCVSSASIKLLPWM